MAKNPFRHKATDVKDIQFWIDESFKELEEEQKKVPVGAFVMLFEKDKEGRVTCIMKKAFRSGGNIFTNGELVNALAQEEFYRRFDSWNKVLNRPPRRK